MERIRVYSEVVELLMWVLYSLLVYLQKLSIVFETDQYDLPVLIEYLYYTERFRHQSASFLSNEMSYMTEKKPQHSAIEVDRWFHNILVRFLFLNERHHTFDASDRLTYRL